ncbi:hypothetical protein AAG906_014336 [Vitis piasezkii]
MNMDLVKSCVLNEGMRRKSQGSSSYKSRGLKNKDRSKSKTNKFANVECHYCHFERETIWVIDSGASIHATPWKDFYKSYTSGDFGSVRMSNDGSAKAIGMGDVRLETSNGIVLILKNVKHIPDIRMNLISTGKLDDERFCNTFRDSQWKLTRGSMVVAKGKKCSSLYLMKTRVINSSINAVNDDSTIELWHNRLGHMSEKDLMILAKKNLFSDNMIFDIKRHLLTPQLNGLAERMNRILVERVRCLLSQSQLPRSFWGEALNIVVHVLNLTPCVPLEFDVPGRIWSDNEISYDHLRVFGCKDFVHIPKDERSKLDAKTRLCVFIGYGKDELGYRFYDPVEDETHDDQHDIGDQSPIAEVPPDIPLKRSTRDRHPSTRYFVDDYVLLTDRGEPESYEEVTGYENKMKWVDVMQDEMKSLHANHSFELNGWVYRVKQEEHTSQPRYKARLVVKGFSQKKNKEKEDMRRVPYASVVGSLMYVMVCTRPDIAYAVGVVNRFLSNPGRLHWEAVKWIMRYLRDTFKLKLTFGSRKPVLVGYTDSDMADDVDNKRYTSGYLMIFSGGVVS